MVDIRQILCPVDFSDASRHALQHAVVIAGWYGSRITGLHVGHPSALAAPPVPIADSPYVVPTEADRHEIQLQLREWLASAATSGLRTDALLADGNPVTRILEHAKSLPADLIVMGTHGRSGFEHLMLGSLTEKVLRKANCPVLTVPPPAVATSKLPFKRLLCPVDFSEPSISALEFALSIAQESDAHLAILHAFDWPAADDLLAERAPDAPAFRRLMKEQATQQLEALIPADVRNWCEPELRLGDGKPYREILAVAEAEQVDLIVMGVHGRNAIDLMMFGSTTHHVIRRASCPVLTLRK